MYYTILYYTILYCTILYYTNVYFARVPARPRRHVVSLRAKVRGGSVCLGQRYTFVYIYIYTHNVYIYIYIHTHMYIYIYIHTYTYTHMYAHVYIYIYIYIYTYTFIDSASREVLKPLWPERETHSVIVARDILSRDVKWHVVCTENSLCTPASVTHVRTCAFA